MAWANQLREQGFYRKGIYWRPFKGLRSTNLMPKVFQDIYHPSAARPAPLLLWGTPPRAPVKKLFSFCETREGVQVLDICAFSRVPLKQTFTSLDMFQKVPVSCSWKGEFWIRDRRTTCRRAGLPRSTTANLLHAFHKLRNAARRRPLMVHGPQS